MTGGGGFGVAAGAEGRALVDAEDAPAGGDLVDEDGGTAGEGFEDGHAEGFVVGEQDEARAFGVGAFQFGFIDIASDLDSFLEGGRDCGREIPRLGYRSRGG